MINFSEHYNFNKEIDSIDLSNFDISRVSSDHMFDYIYDHSPQTIKDYIDSLKDVDQRRDFHPEGSVYNHTKAVTNRLAVLYDINLILAAFLHDTGKDRTTKIEAGIIMQPGHEAYSAEILNMGSPWRNWVRELGGDPNIVRMIIKNHMRLKDMDNNNKNKRWFNSIDSTMKNYLIEFNKADKGGF